MPNSERKSTGDALRENIKQKASELKELFEQTGTGQYKELSVTKLETAVEWALKEINS